MFGSYTPQKHLMFSIEWSYPQLLLYYILIVSLLLNHLTPISISKFQVLQASTCLILTTPSPSNPSNQFPIPHPQQTPCASLPKRISHADTRFIKNTSVTRLEFKASVESRSVLLSCTGHIEWRASALTVGSTGSRSGPGGMHRGRGRAGTRYTGQRQGSIFVLSYNGVK